MTKGQRRESPETTSAMIQKVLTDAKAAVDAHDLADAEYRGSAEYEGDDPPNATVEALRALVYPAGPDAGRDNFTNDSERIEGVEGGLRFAVEWLRAEAKRVEAMPDCCDSHRDESAVRIYGLLHDADAIEADWRAAHRTSAESQEKPR